MGSTSSTPVRDRGDDRWWPIENQNLELNPNEMDSIHNNNNNNNNNSIVNSVEEEQQTRTESLIPLTNSHIERSDRFDESDFAENQNVASNVTSNSEDENVSEFRSSVKSKERQQSLEEFKEELRIKRELRTNAISELRNEISSLRQQLIDEKEITKQLKEERNKENLCQICDSIYNSLENNVKPRISTQINVEQTNGESRDSSVSLRSQLAELQVSLQNANAEILTLSNELAVTKRQAKSLKEVIAASKEIIEIRETELSQLKLKFKEIENSLAEREMHVLSENLRQEYDRQLANIRNLRALYEERSRINAAEKENLNRQLETCRAELSSEVLKNKNLEDHIASLDTDLKSMTTDLFAAKEKVTYYKAENRGLRDEMTVVNQLFGQLLAGFNGNNNIDIDKLTLMLEENRDLLNDITSKEHCKEGSAQIPKLIFDLVLQADKSAVQPIEVESSTTNDSTPSTSSDGSKVSSAQEIIHNLPKVWKVLTELLNHQQLKPVALQENTKGEHCYKAVQTPNGPRMELSVSKTYIRLKDLIMEKKFLQKETKKLKNLNSHLECRLDEQEQRLSEVTIELNKTWNLVGRMQRQHRQLHTQEQVLRYHLQQKRRILGELKEELEYCRRKWALAKEKNNESQSQWEMLRHEFSSRKQSDLNNSGESGYSDSPASEDDEEEEEEEEDRSESIEKTHISRLKKRLSIENFFKSSEKDRKTIRIHSVSPIRIEKVCILRRNSDSLLTQYATEEFQSTSDAVVQPIISDVCAECGENCVKHTVHFDAEAQKSTDHVKISEPVIHNAKHEPSNAQKLVELKTSSSKVKMSCELRKMASAQKPCSTSKHEESLEEMFLRLSGSNLTEANEQSNKTIEIVNNNISPSSSTSHEERERQRSARIERLEGQCKELLTQVTRASNRGDELKKRSNEIHNRFTASICENTKSQSAKSVEKIEPSTSFESSKSDEKCLNAIEKEYLSRRDERLKRLEAESQAYLNRVKSINRRATDVETKLEFLHGRYGSETETVENPTENSYQLTEQNVANELSQPSTSSGLEKTQQQNVLKSDEECLSATEREYLSRREERLKRLEAESQAYMNRLKESVNRRTIDAVSKLVSKTTNAEDCATISDESPIEPNDEIESNQVEQNESSQRDSNDDANN